MYMYIYTLLSTLNYYVIIQLHMCIPLLGVAIRILHYTLCWFYSSLPHSTAHLSCYHTKVPPVSPSIQTLCGPRPHLLPNSCKQTPLPN